MNVHDYYHTEITDLSVLRRDASNRLEGKAFHKNNPGPSVIHMHRSEEPCEGHTHELYGVEQP